MKRRLLERLAVRFQDKEYRDAYAESLLSSSIAAQIKALREQRGWNQGQLGQRAGMKQSQISRLENVNYSGWTIQTLLRLARAFDVALVIKFAGFSEVAVRAEEFSRATLEVPSFDHDSGFRVPETTAPEAPAAYISAGLDVGNAVLLVSEQHFEGLTAGRGRRAAQTRSECKYGVKQTPTTQGVVMYG